MGVIADTHIPDRQKALDPRILPLFKMRRVQAILHAGDVCTPSVLDELSQAAPVYAVQGNRDWLLLGKLPMKRLLQFGGMTIGLAHGHGGWIKYLLDRPALALHGVNFDRFVPRLQAEFPEADAVVFGHAHLTLNQRINGQLFFNPGSPHFPHYKQSAPSLGFLHIRNGGGIRGEIVYLQDQEIISDFSA